MPILLGNHVLGTAIPAKLKKKKKSLYLNSNTENSGGVKESNFTSGTFYFTAFEKSRNAHEREVIFLLGSSSYKLRDLGQVAYYGILVSP